MVAASASLAASQAESSASNANPVVIDGNVPERLSVRAPIDFAVSLGFFFTIAPNPDDVR